MKRRNFVISVVGASVLAAGVTAWGVSALVAPEAGETQKEVKIVEFAGSGVGSHFTSYEKDNYPDLTYAAENAVKAVVNIEKIEEVTFGGGSISRNPFFEFFGIPDGYYEQRPQSQERRSGGSGVIISADGYIVTNNHVVENASKLKVTLNDDRVFDAKIIGTDPTTDVALIKIEAEDLPTLVFGNSNDLRLGEWVLAIGSPFDLRSTVTAGIISAKSRDLNVIPNEFRIESFIQTDAAVNPGNSGGALVNVRGELVGINTVIKSPTGSFTGYSFAVPSSIVQKVVIDLKEYGIVQRALLGVSYRQVDPENEEDEGKDKGLEIMEVQENSAAEEAGLEKGDIIVEVDGKQMLTSSSLSEYIGTKRPNEKVTVSVKRDGKLKQFDVVLRNRAGKAELLPKNYTDAAEALGGTFANISEKTKRSLRIDGGVQVTSVEEGSILSRARVRRNFIITHINDTEIYSTSDLGKISAPITSIDGVFPDGNRLSVVIPQ